MDLLCILAIYMVALICIALTLFTSVVMYALYAFLTAAYDVVSDWVWNLKWKRRCAGRKKK